MSNPMEDALCAVANQKPDNHVFTIGQPLWEANGHSHTCYIAIGFTLSAFSGWLVEVVFESDPTGPTYLDQESKFTATPPASPILHPAQKGAIYFTAAGTPVKSIPHFTLESGRSP